MRNLTYIIIYLASVALAGCGTATKAYRVVDPYELNKQKLSETKTLYTPEYKLPYAKTRGVDYSNEKWGEMIDDQYKEYAYCVKTKFKKDPNLKKLQSINIIIVKDSKFDCKYHNGRCSGEYDSSLKTIFVSRKDLNKKGLVPLLKHEWSHANGILKSDHSNLNKVKQCTRY